MKIDAGNDKCRYCNSNVAPGNTWPTLRCSGAAGPCLGSVILTLLFIILTEDVGLVWGITCPALQF